MSATDATDATRTKTQTFKLDIKTQSLDVEIKSKFNEGGIVVVRNVAAFSFVPPDASRTYTYQWGVTADGVDVTLDAALLTQPVLKIPADTLSVGPKVQVSLQVTRDDQVQGSTIV